MTLKTELNGQPIGFATGSSGVVAERPTVIFIHGSGGSRATWMEQLEALDGDLNTVALELPGHGQTPGPPPDSVAGFAQWVAEVIECWELPESPYIAGHSLGGAIVIEMGLTYSHLLAGLIPIGSGAHLPVNPLLFDGLAQDFEGTLRLAMKWSYNKGASAALVEQGFQGISNNEPFIVINDFRSCDRFDRRGDLDKIHLSTLAVCGARDKMTPPAMSEFLVEKIPGARLHLIENAGHMVMAEQPKALNEAILSFVLKE